MDTTMKELNLEEMETINGGINWGTVFGGGWTGAMIGLGAASLTILAMSNPITGLAAAAIVAGSAAAGGAVGGGITTLIEAITDD